MVDKPMAQKWANDLAYRYLGSGDNLVTGNPSPQNGYGNGNGNENGNGNGNAAPHGV
jgi:hypothetical protein